MNLNAELVEGVHEMRADMLPLRAQKAAPQMRKALKLLPQSLVPLYAKFGIDDNVKNTLDLVVSAICDIVEFIDVFSREAEAYNEYDVAAAMKWTDIESIRKRGIGFFVDVQVLEKALLRSIANRHPDVVADYRLVGSSPLRLLFLLQLCLLISLNI
jgi:hypothetical protein